MCISQKKGKLIVLERSLLHLSEGTAGAYPPKNGALLLPAMALSLEVSALSACRMDFFIATCDCKKALKDLICLKNQEGAKDLDFH